MRNVLILRQISLVAVAAALAFYGALQVSGRSAEAGLVEPVVRRAGNDRPAATRPKSSISIALPARENQNQTPDNDLFAYTDWAPPLPPAVLPRPLPPPKAPIPQAPMMPFNFVGLLEDAAKPTAFLSKGDVLLVATAGDTLDATYRVDIVSSKEIVLTYLPLNQRQSILIPGGL